MLSAPDRVLLRSRGLTRASRGRRAVDVANLRRVVGYSALTVTVTPAMTARAALRQGRRDYADAVWGPGLAAVAVIAALAGRGNTWRRWGLAAAAIAWAARLEQQMLGRIRGSDGEDPRYTEFLEDDGVATVAVKVFVTQVSAPELFGDSLVWDGAWLAAVASAPDALTFPAPIVMSYLLVFATGAKRTERRMQDRPGYRDYQRRVAFFLPRPRANDGSFSQTLRRGCDRPPRQ